LEGGAGGGGIVEGDEALGTSGGGAAGGHDSCLLFVVWRWVVRYGCWNLERKRAKIFAVVFGRRRKMKFYFPIRSKLTGRVSNDICVNQYDFMLFSFNLAG